MFDAHCHTNCSDGNITIEDRIQLIVELGYEAATITDHDFISKEQVKRARAAAGPLPYVPGVELTLAHKGAVVHLLGYFVDPASPLLQTHLQRVQERDRIITTQLLGTFINKEARFHIADLESSSLHTFYSMQLVLHLSRATYGDHPGTLLPDFIKALDTLGYQYADLAPWSVKDGIQLIHDSGGIAVLAHPGGREDKPMQALGFLWHDEEILQTYIAWGLDGIETRNPVHNSSEVQYYEALAERNRLLATSGSDCHGDDPYLGPALMGAYQNLYDNLYEEMLATHSKRQKP